MYRTAFDFFVVNLSKTVLEGFELGPEHEGEDGQVHHACEYPNPISVQLLVPDLE